MDPVTIALIASAGLGAVGKLVKGLGGYAAGKAAKRQSEFRARQFNNEAGIEAQAELEHLNEVGGETAVRAAAGGGGLAGSSLDVLADTERKGMFNARSLIYAGATKAENALYEGRVAKKQGGLALIGGGVGAGATLASSYANANAGT